ncbi:hypothetical protein B296_00012929 [Ensete ventricosum]|uniref:Uncharacterized protein n=1 Tax=Ensete ventricosum TaxID=4639 RepID=A0A426X7M0_ENSVE|nr:hypothetical protein B296_00012929 [Ensete ventricosum]
MQWDLAGSSLGNSLKELGSSLGTRMEITGKKTGGLTVRMSEVSGLARVELNQLTKEMVNIKVKPEFKKWRESRRLDHLYHRIRVTTNRCRRVNRPDGR